MWETIRRFMKDNGLQIWIIILGVMIAIQIYLFAQQRADVNEFVNRGPRFTAQDGKVLCRRIQDIEEKLDMGVEGCDFIDMHAFGKHIYPHDHGE